MEVFKNNNFNKNKLRTSFRLPQKKKIFIIPTRLSPYKGIDFLIKTINRTNRTSLKDLYFVIAIPATRYRQDEIAYSEIILKMITKYAVNNFLEIKFVDYNSMSFLYQAVDGFILPS